MPLNIKVTQKLDLQRRAAETGRKIKTVTADTTLTATESGSLTVMAHTVNFISITLPAVGDANGCWFSFYNAAANGFKIVATTNVISTSLGVNKADKFKILYYNHTTNWGLGCTVVCDGATYFHQPYQAIVGNVGPGFAQG